MTAPFTESFADPTAHAGPPVLVVDSSNADRRLVAGLVEQLTGLRVICAADGAEALALVRKDAPALVLTGMPLPNLDGMQLVEALRAEFPSVPVILMTANGSEEAAISALRAGATNYIPKRYIRQELPPILAQVLAVTRIDRRRNELMSCLAELECRFVLDNDPELVPLLVAHLQEHVERLGLCDRNGRIRLGVALQEAMLNGLYHGNLDVSSNLKQDGGDSFNRLAAKRRLESPYRERRLNVSVQLNREQATFVIRDDGAGFDVDALPDPTDPENLLRPSGRGLLLIRTFMTKAVHNAAGNELTMTWRRRAASS